MAHSFPRPITLLTALLAMLPSAIPAGAQQRIEIAGGPTCSECRIVVEPYLTLGGEVSPGIGSPFFHAARDALGRVWITGAREQDVGVYGADGRPLNTLGGRGQGPGEFMTAMQILARAQTVSVLDPGNQRETVYDMEYKIVRTVPLPGPVKAAVVLDDSLSLYNINFWTPDKVGYPLHLVDLTGRVVLSVGYDGKVVRRDSPLGDRALAAASGGGFWAARTTEYEVEKWTVAGERRLSIARSVVWFGAHDGMDWTPPLPWIEEIWEDSDGLLWVAIRVAAPDWKRAAVMRGDLLVNIADHDAFFDTILEVIDPRRGEVLAGTRVDPWIKSYLGGGLAASYKEDEEGWPFLHLWEIKLDRIRKGGTR
jgi:hypothetical protein